MRILVVNTSEMTGGAAVAANRLVAALNNNGVKAKMLVRDKTTDNITVSGMNHKPFRLWHFLWERWCIFCYLHFSKKHLFEIDIANSGFDITGLNEFKEADVIHLHWINQGMLSLKGIRKIFESGKPVVWTLHDLWPVSGICHYARQCDKFVMGCKDCPLLPKRIIFPDLAKKIWNKKKHIYLRSNIHFVACSEWLANTARKSGSTNGLNVSAIPNSIDTNIFQPLDKVKVRKKLGLPENKKIVLFVSQRVTDVRKGASLLIDAINKICADNPVSATSIVVALLGSHAETLKQQINIPCIELGYISGDNNLAQVYSAADVFVLPSMEDNLPNTIMEALACGVPCVGFNVGGIPEMIDHLKNGYVAEYKNAGDLAKGIWWILSEADSDQLRQNALHKVHTSYSQHNVASRYIEVYESALKGKYRKS
ncbi:MAG: glycosyltransferase family 4 protein [Prevotella sp.]|nr:glycosyltransferase family 4 protein [Prevotella sp.]